VELIVVEDAAALAGRAAEWIARAMVDAVRARGAFHLALAGGGTPRATHEKLAAVADLPWHRVHVWFGDERCVPPDHADANYRMARESLLSRVAIPAAQVHRLEAERADADAAAREYAAALPARLDVCMLGMGEDGHTASLFPGAASIDEQTRLVIAIDGAPKPPPRRMTITPPVIAAARATLVLSAGAGKADMLARVLEGPIDPHTLPVQLARDGVWIVDRAATSKLRSVLR
jgi:6-phosphogluconolactonase